VSVTVLAIESVIAGVTAPDPPGQPLPGGLELPRLPAATHVLSVIVGLALVALAPRLWRGTRTAVTLAVLGLVTLAALNGGHGRYGDATVQAGLAVLLALARGAFRLGCSNRPRPSIVWAALVAWGLAFGALVCAPLLRDTAPGVARVLHRHVGHALGVVAASARLDASWGTLVDLLIGSAAVISVLALRSLVRPAPGANHHAEHEYRAARAIIDAHGTDSLSPFLLRPDKALAFAAGGVLAYRVIGGTAVISADPVAPAGRGAEVLAGFQDQARRRGWEIVLWGAAARDLDAYRQLGLRAVCAGEEAFVDPLTFSLDGRAVRKLRQSVHRVRRRGWHIVALDGREIDAGVEAEIDHVRARWREAHRRVHGFAMGMGAFASEVRPDDLFLLAWSPDGNLRAVMRFVSCGVSLSLDTMERVGDTPNGLNEALVVRAIEVARERGIAELSLNYAGLAHLLRREPSRNRAVRAVTGLAVAPLRRRFQMDRLVRFNDKFSPEWRPRYLVYRSGTALPWAVVRVLQAEGYLPQRRPLPLTRALRALLARGAAARPRPRRPVGEAR
jgi:lysyl-tRNA synthetase class 2